MPLARPLLLLVVIAASWGRAQGQAVPDSVFAAVKDHAVVVQTSDGVEQAGTLLSFDQDGAVVALAPSGEVVLVPRALIVVVRLVTEPVRQAPVVLAGPPRHVALQLGLVPSVMVDLEWGRLYAFVNGSVLTPFFPSYAYDPVDGTSSSSPTWAFTAGAGGSFSPFDSSGWRLDLFGLLGLTNLAASGNAYGDPISFSVGVGVGLHYTAPSGFTVGFKLPLVGVAITGPSTTQTDFSSRLGQFYATHLVALPVVSLGYRF